tara:strand:+ start:265 stop:669 length:405 start_codon:yes stop_codon:yes gene_type:complete
MADKITGPFLTRIESTEFATLRLLPIEARETPGLPTNKSILTHNSVRTLRLLILLTKILLMAYNKLRLFASAKKTIAAKKKIIPAFKNIDSIKLFPRKSDTQYLQISKPQIDASNGRMIAIKTSIGRIAVLRIA